MIGYYGSTGVSARQYVIASLCFGGLKYLSSNDQTGNFIENKRPAVSHNPLGRHPRANLW